MYEIERGLEVDVEHGIPLLLAHPEHEPVLCDPRVVDQDVDPSEFRHDLLHDLVGLLEIGGIGCISLHLVAECAYFPDRSFGRFVDDKVGERHVGTFRCEFQGNGLADSSCCARDEGDFSFK